jgi:hypothetical protein
MMDFTGQELAEFYDGFDDRDEARAVLNEVMERHCEHSPAEPGFTYCPACGAALPPGFFEFDEAQAEIDAEYAAERRVGA